MVVGMLICGGWILVYAVGTLARAAGTSSAVVPISPQVRIAQDLTSRLRTQSEFANITVMPHVDYPERMRVSGRVASAADLTALKARLLELDSQQSYIIDAVSER